MTRRRPATEGELQKALNLVDGLGLSQREAAAKIGVARPTLEGWLHKARAMGMIPGETAVVNEVEVIRLRYEDQIRELESTLRSIRREELTAEVVRKHILDLKEQTPSPPNWPLRKLAKGHEGVPLTIWSDWHWGEVVDPEQVGGVNEYSIATAQRRARTLVERTIHLCDRLSPDWPGIVICLGGDMISGDIHDELSETNELPTMPILLDLYGVLMWAIGRMADRFGRVFVPVVAGNHGRMTHKPRFKNRAFSNFDWLLGCLLEKHFQNDDRVQFQIPSGADAFFTVQGHRFLLTHGDNLGVGGGDGIIGALGPILRGDFKIRRSSYEVGQAYDTLLIGHWHQYLPLERVVVNGSLKGFDEYAHLKLRASPEPPRQALLFVHHEHGITSTRAVNAETPKAKADAVEFVTWRRAA